MDQAISPTDRRTKQPFFKNQMRYLSFPRRHVPRNHQVETVLTMESTNTSVLMTSFTVSTMRVFALRIKSQFFSASMHLYLSVGPSVCWTVTPSIGLLVAQQAKQIWLFSLSNFVIVPFFGHLCSNEHVQ